MGELNSTGEQDLGRITLASLYQELDGACMNTFV
jgi:hypothetical protein